MKYIESDSENEGCFFCDALVSDKDRDNLVLYRGERTFLIMNRYPYTNAHLMAVPNRHVGEITELKIEEISEMMNLVQESVRVLKKAVKPHGFNVGMNLGRVAGAGVVDHVHLHIVPRWGGDVNFMPVLGETKVISEHIMDTYDRLKPYFLR